MIEIFDNSLEVDVMYHADITPIKKYEKGDMIDLRAAEDVFIPVGEARRIPLGVSMRLPEGYEAHIYSRSSLFDTHGIILVNGVGIIDSSYCGTNDVWQFPAYCLKGKTVLNGVCGSYITKDERICQFRLFPNMGKIDFAEVTELEPVDRKGFGSTGRK